MVTIAMAGAMVLAGGNRTNADFTFGEPINLGPTVNSGYSQTAPTMSADGLELYFNSNRPVPGLDEWNIWMVTRPTQDDDWGDAVPLGPEINSESEDNWPRISPDGLELYFASFRPDGYGAMDIWVTRRSALCEPWGPAVNLGPPVNDSDDQFTPSITADGLELFFSHEGDPGGRSIWTAKRAARDEPWGEPVNLGPLVNSSRNDCLSSISADGLVLCFSGHPFYGVRPGGEGRPDIWVTTRPTRDDPWGPPWNPGPPLNTAYADSLPCISADGRWLYFSDFWWNSPQDVRPGGRGDDDLWKSPIVPIVDFNGDGQVDGRDLLGLLQHLDTGNPLFDIGPNAWGDAVVDLEDVKVLAGYIGKAVIDGTLIAHWALDETEETIAYDSAQDNDATVIGDALWQPENGKVNGALLFDGLDDHVETPLRLDPAEGVFSVFAWINGGAPGQVILSQENSANWLMADDEEGVFRTDISDPVKMSRRGSEGGLPLISSAVIADNNWHRVGFVWDGSDRILYVDDIEVARDALSGLSVSVRGPMGPGGLNIGCGKDLAEGSFWTGMIDDVRIYNRVVEP